MENYKKLRKKIKTKKEFMNYLQEECQAMYDPGNKSFVYRFSCPGAITKQCIDDVDINHLIKVFNLTLECMQVNLNDFIETHKIQEIGS